MERERPRPSTSAQTGTPTRITQADIIRGLKQARLDLVKAYALPRYRQPAGYRSYRLLTDAMILNAYDLEVRVETMGRAQALESPSALAYVAAELLKDAHFPLLFAGGEIIEACLQTELPDWLEFSDFKWPLPCATFMLPQGAMTLENGSEVLSISYARVEAGSMPLSTASALRLDRTPLRAEHGTYFIWAELLGPDGDLFHWCMDRAVTGKVSSVGLQFNHISDYASMQFDSVGESSAIEKNDQYLLLALPNVLFNLLMIMQERPELVEPRKMLRKVKGAGKGPPEPLWEPRYVGRTFRYSRTLHEPTGARGTHASPRSHWRRGHWRQQACGPLRQEHKTIWIQPIFILGREI
jgi:hypothetical protein